MATMVTMRPMVSIAHRPPQSTASHRGTRRKGKHPGWRNLAASERSHRRWLEAYQAAHAKAWQQACLRTVVDPRPADLQVAGHVVGVPEFVCAFHGVFAGLRHRGVLRWNDEAQARGLVGG